MVRANIYDLLVTKVERFKTKEIKTTRLVCLAQNEHKQLVFHVYTFKRVAAKVGDTIDVKNANVGLQGDGIKLTGNIRISKSKKGS